jgi:hypothetical protein
VPLSVVGGTRVGSRVRLGYKRAHFGEAAMNKLLSDAIVRLKELPEERQEAAASLLLDFLDHGDDFELTPEQISEIERRLESNDVATDEEVKAFFERMKA